MGLAQLRSYPGHASQQHSARAGHRIVHLAALVDGGLHSLTDACAQVFSCSPRLVLHLTEAGGVDVEALYLDYQLMLGTFLRRVRWAVVNAPGRLREDTLRLDDAV